MPAITLDQLQAQARTLEQQIEQAVARVNQQQGALMLCKQLIAQLQQAEAAEPLPEAPSE